MHWETIEIGGRKADVLAPLPGNSTDKAAIFLHGYDRITLKENAPYTTALCAAGIPVVCPDGDASWWLDETYSPFDATRTAQQYLRRDVVPWITAHWKVQPPRIGLFGVEMGGQGALQLSYRSAREFPVVVAISPKIDFETWWGHGLSLDVLFSSKEAARQRIATLQIHPLDWPASQLLLCDPADTYCIDGAVTLASKLASSGVFHTTDFTTTHGGFGWGYANHVAAKGIEYLRQHLNEQTIAAT